MKRLPWLRMVTISLVLYSITIITYFYMLFRPIYGKINELISSMHNDDIAFFFIVSLILCLLASIAISFIYDEILLCTKPIIAIHATLKSKESVMGISGNNRGFSSIGYTYNLTFEDNNDIEISFNVIAKYYFSICEGNEGILKYKQSRCNRFIDFEIIEIE